MNKVELHQEVANKLNRVYADKNHDYLDSFAVGYHLFDKMSIVQRLLDKWLRLFGLSYNKAKVKNESFKDSLLDIANYCIMTVIEIENDSPDDPARKLAEALKELAGIEE